MTEREDASALLADCSRLMAAASDLLMAAAHPVVRAGLSSGAAEFLAGVPLSEVKHARTVRTGAVYEILKSRGPGAAVGGVEDPVSRRTYEAMCDVLGLDPAPRARTEAPAVQGRDEELLTTLFRERSLKWWLNPNHYVPGGVRASLLLPLLDEIVALYDTIATGPEIAEAYGVPIEVVHALVGVAPFIRVLASQS